jgi:hypothetical protein
MSFSIFLMLITLNKAQRSLWLNKSQAYTVAELDENIGGRGGKA